MALALGCSLIASVLCLRGAAGPWRSRLHHLLPTPLMALGMGHAGSFSGLPAAVAAAAGLWVLGVVLARRARDAGGARLDLWADAVDAFAMAVALLAAGLASAASGAPVSVVAGHAGHAGHAGAPITGESGASVLLPVTAASLAVAVVLVRLGAGARSPVPSSRSLAPALLMAVSLVAMLAG